FIFRSHVGATFPCLSKETKGERTVVKKPLMRVVFSAACLLAASLTLNAQVTLIARGSLTSSRAGSYKDLSGLNNTLENGVSANLLGGLGSALTYVDNDTFLALPDRGPNAVPFNPAVDDTVTWIPRFHTLRMKLQKNHGAGLPYTFTPELR